MDGLHSSAYFQVHHSLYQSFGDSTKCANYNWHHRHFQVPQFFQFPCKVQVLPLYFASFQFYSVVSRYSKVNNSASSPFLIDYYKVWLPGRDLVIHLYVKIPWKFVRLILRDNSGLCIYHLFVWSNFNFLHNSQPITLPPTHVSINT